MGVDTNLHIGPYLVQLKTKEIKVEKTLKTCSSENCKINKNNKELTVNFCPECGFPANNKTCEETKEIGIRDILRSNDGFSDKLTYTDPMGGTGRTFISNIRSPFKRNESSEEEAWDLTNLNVQEEITWFKNEYKAILETIEKELGKDAYEIKWGVIQWYS